MQLQIERDGNVVVIHCQGPLVAGQTAELRTALADAVAETGCVILELHSVSRIDSAGLGMLARLCATARGRSGDVKVVGPCGQVAEILELTLQARLLTIYPSIEAALAAFSSAVQTHA
ncbi:MAG: STAS domain-containing protein [Terriglobales bacterium]